MRIVVSGRGAEDMLGVVRLTLVASLRAEGHQVMGIDPRRHGGTAPLRTEAVVAALAGFEADLAIVVPTPGDLDHSRLRSATVDLDVLTMAVHLGATGGGAVTRLGDVPDHVVDFDLVAVPHGHAVEQYGAWGRHGLIELRPAVLPSALDEAPAAAIASHVVVCVGDADAHNADTVRSLLDVGLDVGIVGEGWEDVADLRLRSAGRCSVQERSAWLAAADLVVELPPTLEHLSAADAVFEECLLSQAALDAAALGTPLVGLRRPGVEQHLEIDTEILVAERVGDLPDLVRLVMSNPEELASIGLAAQIRLRSDHRWDSRWNDLREWFGIETPEPAVTTSGVSVVIPVDTGTDRVELDRTMSSIVEADPSTEIIIVGPTGDAELSFEASPPNLVVLDTGDAATGLAMSIGINRSQREWVTVARAGVQWRSDRIRSATTVAGSCGAAAVHSGDGPSGHYDRWDALRSGFGGAGFAPATCLLRRETAASGGVWRALIGDPVAIADLVATGPVVWVDEPLVTGADVAARLSPGADIKAFHPAIGRALDGDAAAAAAFCDLAASVVGTEPVLAWSLIELALDHVPGDDHRAHDILSRMLVDGPLDEEQLDDVAADLGRELFALVPETSDRVWNDNGQAVAVAQLVVDPAGLGPDQTEQVVSSYLQWFSAGEPVRLVIRSSEPRDAVVDWLAGVAGRSGADIVAAADVVVAETVGIAGSEDLVIGAAGRDPEELRRLVDRWMADRRAALDALSAGTAGTATR